MTDEQVQRVIDLADEILARPVTKEDAFRKFLEMGLVDKNGQWTEWGANFALAMEMDLGKDRYK